MRITDMNEEILSQLEANFGDVVEVELNVPGFANIGCLGDVLEAVQEVISENGYVLYQP